MTVHNTRHVPPRGNQREAEATFNRLCTSHIEKQGPVKVNRIKKSKAKNSGIGSILLKSGGNSKVRKSFGNSRLDQTTQGTFDKVDRHGVKSRASSHTLSNRDIRRQITFARTENIILDLWEAYKEVFTGATTLSALSKLNIWSKNAVESHGTALHEMVDTIISKLDRMSCEVLARAAKVFTDLPKEHVGRCLFALQREVVHGTLPDRSSKLESLTSQELAGIVTATVTTGFSSSELFSAIETRVLRVDDELRSQLRNFDDLTFAAIVGGFSRVGFFSEKLFNALLEEEIVWGRDQNRRKRVDSFDVQQLCAIAGAFAAVGQGSSRLFNTLAAEICLRENVLSLMTTEDLAHIGAIFSTRGDNTEELFELLESILLDGGEGGGLLHECSLQDLVTIANAFAYTTYNSTRIFVAMESEIFRRVALNGAEGRLLLEAEEIVCLVDSYVKRGTGSRGLFEYFGNEILPADPAERGKISEVVPLQLVTLALAFTKVKHTPRDLMEGLGCEALRGSPDGYCKVGDFDIEAIVNMAWAFVASRTYNHHIISLLIKRLSQRLNEGQIFSLPQEQIDKMKQIQRSVQKDPEAAHVDIKWDVELPEWLRVSSSESTSLLPQPLVASQSDGLEEGEIQS